MRITYRETALKQLKALPFPTRARIVGKVEFYASQEDPLAFATHLVGYDAYRFRVGNYRVVFDVSNDSIDVLLVVKREGAYRNI